MNLFEKTQAVCSTFDYNPNPNGVLQDEWVSEIDLILDAVGECTIRKDTIAKLELRTDSLKIIATYTCRGCYQENDITIPLFILQSENPLLTAKLYRLDKQLANAKNQLKIAHTIVDRWEKEQLEIENQIHSLKS